MQRIVEKAREDLLELMRDASYFPDLYWPAEAGDTSNEDIRSSLETFIAFQTYGDSNMSDDDRTVNTAIRHAMEDLRNLSAVDDKDLNALLYWYWLHNGVFGGVPRNEVAAIRRIIIQREGI